MHRTHRARPRALFLLALATAGSGAVRAEDSSPPVPAAPTTLETVIVTGERPASEQPNTTEHVTAAQASEQVNAVNTEDMLKYTPSLVVRKRHYGDTQDPIATRTSGVGASARNLIYVDGILISSPIGNNNTSASPHFGVAATHDILSIDVLYGPFAAEYPGNSVGAVVNINTRMPEKLEYYADALSAFQTFKQYATDHTYTSSQLAAGIGDRNGAFAWRLSANHLDSTGQPLGFVTLTRPSATSTAGTPVMGAFNDVNRTNAPILVIGANSIEHQVQDTDTVKLAYELGNRMRVAYTASVFHQSDHASAETYLRDAAGTPVYSGSVNFENRNYSIAASSFSNGVYVWDQTHLAQGLSLRSAPARAFEWEVDASSYDYSHDRQRVPTGALPSASGGGAGTINFLDGTGWYTLDAKGVIRTLGPHVVSFGLHRDEETFSQSRYNTAAWQSGGSDSLAASAHGHTSTDAAWVQDVWNLASEWKAILGLRYESWRAFDGSNYSASPALNVAQPEISGRYASPKASLSWHPSSPWLISGSWGGARRMPTVTELYQAITTGATLTVPNPNLRPEHANSFELAAERDVGRGRTRVSIFQENMHDALLSQTAPLVAGSNTLFSYVQNVDRTRVRGIELAADQNDVLVRGLELSGSLTYVDGRTIADAALPAAVGKQIPQLPHWRGNVVATYRPNDSLSFTVAARYSTRSFGTIDNSDPVGQTYQGFGGYFVADTRVQYRIGKWTTSFGIDNVNNERYFLFHPFPQRTYLLELRYAS